MAASALFTVPGDGSLDREAGSRHGVIGDGEVPRNTAALPMVTVERGAADDAGKPPLVAVQVSMLNGATWSVELDSSWTGERLQQHLAAVVGAPPSEIMLLLGTTLLRPEATLLLEYPELQCSPVVQMLLVKRRLTLSAGWDRKVHLWEFHSSPEASEQITGATWLRELVGHTGAVNCVAADAGMLRAVTGSYDRTIRLWDLSTGSCTRVMDGHADAVNGISVDWVTMKAVSASDDGRVSRWDLRSGICEHSLSAADGAAVNGVAVDWHSGVALTPCDDHKVYVWDLTANTLTGTLYGHSDAVNCLDVSWKGRRAISGGDDGNLCLWDLDTHECLATLAVSNNEVEDPHHGYIETAMYCVSLDWESRRAVSGSRDSIVRIWDLCQNTLLREIRAHIGPVYCLLADWANEMVMSGSRDNTIKVWNLAMDSGSLVLRAHKSVVRCMCSAGS